MNKRLFKLVEDITLDMYMPEITVISRSKIRRLPVLDFVP